MVPVSIEEELIRRAKVEPEAFGELYELHFDRIYYYVYNQVKSHPETQDIVSDTFLKAFRAINTYKPTGKPIIVWLYRIAKNSTIDYFRRANRYYCFDAPEIIEIEPEFEQVENREWINQAMQLLNSDQQEVLRMHYLEDMKFKDIAKATNRTEGAVKAMSLRALKRLRSVLGKEGVTCGM